MSRHLQEVRNQDWRRCNIICNPALVKVRLPLLQGSKGTATSASTQMSSLEQCDAQCQRFTVAATRGHGNEQFSVLPGRDSSRGMTLLRSLRRYCMLSLYKRPSEVVSTSISIRGFWARSAFVFVQNGDRLLSRISKKLFACQKHCLCH